MPLAVCLRFGKSWQFRHATRNENPRVVACERINWNVASENTATRSGYANRVCAQRHQSEIGLESIVLSKHWSFKRRM